MTGIPARASHSNPPSPTGLFRPGLILLFALLGAWASHPAAAGAQARAAGPVIDDFGAVFSVDGLDVPVETARRYQVVFEVYQETPSKGEVNPDINTLARFLNMHGRAGVPLEMMELALVLHGPAAKAALSHRGYRERYGTDNPDLPLLEALTEAGARIYLCGQSAASRGLLPKEDLAQPVELALSAMTMLVTLQDEGYELIAF